MSGNSVIINGVKFDNCTEMQKCVVIDGILREIQSGGYIMRDGLKYTDQDFDHGRIPFMLKGELTPLTSNEDSMSSSSACNIL